MMFRMIRGYIDNFSPESLLKKTFPASRGVMNARYFLTYRMIILLLLEIAASWFGKKRSKLKNGLNVGLMGNLFAL